MVKRVEERRYDVVADVVVAERGELLAHGVDGDARGVADHRYDTPGVDGVAVCTAEMYARERMKMWRQCRERVVTVMRRHPLGKQSR